VSRPEARYLMVLPVPFRPLGRGRFAVESAFAEHLRLLLQSLRPQVERIEVLAPVMDQKSFDALHTSLAELHEERDGVEFTPAYSLPRGTLHHLFALPRLAWMLWRAVGRCGYVHGGPSSLTRPFQNLALLFGWMRRRTTVFVTDIDQRESPRMSLSTGICSYGAYLRAHYVHRPWFVLQLWLAVRLCSTLFLKGRALVADYGRGLSHVHYLLDCAHSRDHVLAADRLAAKCRRIADERRPLRACYFGRLVAYKGVDRMLSAIAIACQGGADITFDVYGAGECEPALRLQVAQLGLEQVVSFHGPKPYGHELFAELEQCDLLLAAGLAQDTPRSAIDAQAAGMGVLAFNTYYYRELQQQGAGVELVQWPDVAALAVALQGLAGHRDRVAALSRRAIEFARHNTQEDWLRLRAQWTLGRSAAAAPAPAAVPSQRT
jgi:glycosyltransferase involved in cell wall biosynthesis